VALRLQCRITLLHPSNGHIPGIFPDVHVISKSQPTCGTAQKGPQLQAALFNLIDEDRGGPLTTPRQDACVARSSPVFVFRPEDPRDGPSPRLLLTSASLLLTSCLRVPSATGPKVVSPTWTSHVLNLSDYKYYLVVVADFSHYSWIFPLRAKSETFPTLLHFFAWVSTQFGITIKAV